MALRASVIWNYLSLAILALSGLLMNGIIAYFHPPQVLGVFNQAFAIYITAAQFAVLGIHYSILRGVAVDYSESNRVRNVLASGLTATFLPAVIVSALVFLFRADLGRLLASPQVEDAILWVAPAVGLFGINKCLLAALNGLQKMSLFALGQSLRYIALVSFVAWQCTSGAPEETLSGAFVFSESLLLVVLLWLLSPYLRGFLTHISRTQVLEHFFFGARGFLTGVLVELNSRVDILILGIFLDDTKVGLYSLAAFFAEGFYQILVVIRNFANPQLARCLESGDVAQIGAWLRTSVRVVYPALFVAALGCLFVFHFYLIYIAGIGRPIDTVMILAILLSGIVCAAPFVPFDYLLLQAGRPGLQSVQLGLIVGTNIVLNFALIPLFGLRGSATATALSFVAGVMFLHTLVKRACNISVLGSALSAKLTAGPS